jgi:phosphoglycolate phosphatase
MNIDIEKITHIIFDWDGTLMDSAAKIVSCMQKAAFKANLPIPTDTQIKHIIGISLLPAVQQLFDVNVEKAQEVCDFYKHIFLHQDQTPSPLFDDAHDVLGLLSNQYTLGVATGKARLGLTRAFENTNTSDYFRHSICADEADSKPSPDMLLKLIKSWNIQAHQAVMIGDTVYDMQMAEAIMMPRIGVSYGVHDKQALMAHKPSHIIDKLWQLPNILKNR